tara:strand:- start:562 stop:1071 length:510 start_codon:yes stop_codon:yes gene_type:complete
MLNTSNNNSLSENTTIDNDEVIVTVNAIPINTVTPSIKLIHIYNMSKTIKLLALIDICFNIFYSFYHFFYIIPLLMSIFGYYGAQKFNKVYIIIYGIYIIIFNLIKSILLFIYFNTSILDIILSFLCIIIGLCICKLLISFYKYINNLSNEELILLNDLKNIKYRFVYY